MERVLKNLSPEKVFYYFEEISKIPRGSGNEKQVSDYLLKLAMEKGWEVIQDKALNIIIKKGATKGYENYPTVLLQGHMDMVCEKNEGVAHDFLKDPIKLKVIDNMIYAENTTLGADNGIAVAMSLAILDNELIEHPPIEVLITTDEEKGMTGAFTVDGSIFKAKYLINIDSEKEGEITASCAGGTELEFKVAYSLVEKNQGSSYKISVKGLHGGHSGLDIDKQRGNANKILGRILADLYEDIDLVSISGGSKKNAIPREAKAIINTEKEDYLLNKIEQWEKIIKNEYTVTDPAVTIAVEKTEKLNNVIDRESFKKLVSLLNIIPSGVLSKNNEINLVIASNNQGVIEQDEKFIYVYSNPRSSVKSLLSNSFVPSMMMLAQALYVEFKEAGGYPGWEYAKDSKIRELCLYTYKQMYNKESVVKSIHAGLECGLLIDKIHGLDAISLGADIYDAHTPNEHVSIDAVEKLYNLLVNMLKMIK